MSLAAHAAELLGLAPAAPRDGGIPESGANLASVAPATSANDFWRPAWSAAMTALSASNQNANISKPSDVGVSRVSQLDADLLDDELFGMLKSELLTAFKYMQGSFLSKENLDIELYSLLQLALFVLSVGSASRRASYGQSLQNLQYRSVIDGRGITKRQVWLAGLLTVGLPYILQRLGRYMAMQGWSSISASNPQSRTAYYKLRLWQLVRRGEKAFQLFSFVNLLLFLRFGQYKSLSDRVLGMKLVYAQPQATRFVSYEFLNRQMVWHALTEFILSVAPVISMRSMRRSIKSFVNALTGGLIFRSASGAGNPELLGLPDNICAFCHTGATPSPSNSGQRQVVSAEAAAIQASLVTAAAEEAKAMASATGGSGITNPHRANCGHDFCYICVSAAMMAEGQEGAECPRCGVKITSIERVINLKQIEEEEDDGNDAAVSTKQTDE
ncbi:hypothetical protein GQ42DRAFT_160461 [Ramicandelaber brevisporus]|nr:hypothetical protein GQ42DRAFT_160461 [Ramicandelaber brevisporus]